MTRISILAALVAVTTACTEREPPPSGPDPVPKPRGGADTEPAIDDAKLGYIGVVTPRETSQAVSPLKAQIAEIAVKLGDKVTKGQILARFDPKDIVSQLRIEEAALKARQADVGRTSGAAQAARKVYERDKNAFDAGVGSKADMEASFGRWQEIVGEQSGAAANVDQQRNVIARLKDNIKTATVVAEIDGRVGLIYVHAGDRVEDGRPVMRIDSDGDNIVKFAIPGDDARRVAQGDHVDVMIESEPKPLDGVISAIAPSVDPVAQMIVAEASLPAPPSNLRTGVRCRIRARGK